MVDSAKPLTSEERALLEHYFSSYEFAIDVNKALRGEQPASLSVTAAVKAGEQLAKVIADKGLSSNGTEVLYRSMDRAYVAPTDLATASYTPVGCKVKCLVTAADSPHCVKFGGSAYTYVITMPAGERYIRNFRKNIGVADWHEYLMPPGMIWHYGDYDGVSTSAVPVVYSARDENELNAPTIEGCLRRAGMSFTSAVPKATVAVGGGKIIPLGTFNPRTLDQRYMVFPWGAERTNTDGTVSIFDINRSNVATQTTLRNLARTEPASSTRQNGILVNTYDELPPLVD